MDWPLYDSIQRILVVCSLCDQSCGNSGEKRDEKDIWDEVSALGETVGGRESSPLVLSSALGIMMLPLCTNHTR